MKRLREVLLFLCLPLCLPAPAGRAQDPCVPEFDPLPIFDVGDNFGMSHLADFDGDGHVDLSVGLTFHMGDGTGVFGERIDSVDPWFVAFDMRTDDYDGDGALDAAVVSFGSEAVWFYYGRLDGGRQPLFEEGLPVSIAGVSEPAWHMDKGDFNNDGRTDLVAISRGPGSHAILLNDGARQFTVRRLETTISGHMVAVGDYDGDRNDDIAVGSGVDLRIARGRGDGTFEEEVVGRLGRPGEVLAGHRFRAADLDGDGRSDLVATAQFWVLVYFGRDFVQGEFAFPSEPSIALPVEGRARFVEVIDLNSDGVLDMVALAAPVNPDTSVYRVFVGQLADERASYFGGPSVTTELPGPPSVLAAGDVNGDGAPDLVVTTEHDNRGRVFLNTRDCPPAFVPRGDGNGDGSINVSDPVSVLNYLFAGGDLACPGASEVNGDDALNVSDPVYLLAFLFQGGEAPVGDDPTSCVE